MAEGYRLGDFLLFSARVYDRIFIRHFEAFGALSLLLALAALLALGALVWRGRLPGRPVLAALAGIWLWVGASFLWWLYLPINWAIGWWLPVFGLQALLLAGIAWRTPPTLGLPYRSEVVPAAVLLLGGLLLPIPALWCGFSGATLLALERSVGGGLLLTAPLLAIAGCWLAGRPTRA